MKLPSRYLDTLGEEKGKSREKRLGVGGEGDKSCSWILLETLPFGCFLEATPPILLYLCFLVL